MSGASRIRTRILCIGNEIMGDDALGFHVAERLKDVGIERVEIVYTSVAGFELLDLVTGRDELIVVDTIQTGRAAPGTIFEIGEGDLGDFPAGALHGIGLSDVLAAGRKLGMPVPDNVTIFAVEAADALTVGGEMHPDVRAAVIGVVRRIREHVAEVTGER